MTNNKPKAPKAPESTLTYKGHVWKLNIPYRRKDCDDMVFIMSLTYDHSPNAEEVLEFLERMDYLDEQEYAKQGRECPGTWRAMINSVKHARSEWRLANTISETKVMIDMPFSDPDAYTGNPVQLTINAIPLYTRKSDESRP